MDKETIMQLLADGVISNEVAAKYFPDLKESRDERIRQFLIRFVRYYKEDNDSDDFSKEDCLAWLEGHGESIDKIAERARTEKQRVLVTESDGVANIDWDSRSIQDVKRLLEYGLGYIKKLEKQGEPTEINSEFDSQLNRLLKQFESLPKEELASSLSFYLNVVQNDGTYKDEEEQGEQKPKVEYAYIKFRIGDKIRRKTPSSCDKDMQVARIEKDYYICNHIGKFSSEVVPFSKQSGYELIEQKPAAWSEDDEIRYKTTLDDLEAFLEDTKQKPPREILSLMSKDNILTQIQIDIDWFKSIKDRIQNQITWKPSDGQMELLKEACDQHWEPDGLDPLYTLYQDLKKLREE